MLKSCLPLFIGPLLAILGACASAQAPAQPMEPVAVPTPLASGASLGSAEAPTAPSASETFSADTEQALELTRRSLRSTAEWLARGVDSWFGDKPFEQGGKVTDGELSVGLHKRQGESRDLALRFNARWRLPNVEQRTYLFVGRDDQRDVVTDRPDAFSRAERPISEANADPTLFAGLALALREPIDFRIGLRGGLKPYAQARYHPGWQLSPADRIDFRETVFWTVDQRIGSTTVVSYDHAFSPTLAGRWLNSATISQSTKQLEWNSSLGAYESLGGQRLLSFEALLSGVRNSGVGVSDYGLRTKWEKPIHQSWVLAEFVFGHFWPRKDVASERSRAWELGATLKLKF